MFATCGPALIERRYNFFTAPGSGVRGKVVSIRESHASCGETLREQRNARLVTRQRTAPPLPASPPESLGAQASCLLFAARMAALPGIRGERRNAWNADPGRREGLLPPRLPWAIFCRPLQGSRRKQRRPAAAHSRMSNLQAAVCDRRSPLSATCGPALTERRYNGDTSWVIVE